MVTQYKNLDEYKKVNADFLEQPIVKGFFEREPSNNRNDREDLEQEIKLKVIEAVLHGKIEIPPTFTIFKEEFDRNNRKVG